MIMTMHLNWTLKNPSLKNKGKISLEEKILRKTSTKMTL